jgi:hypothetical protein
LPATQKTIHYGVNIDKFPYGWADECRSDGDFHAHFLAKQGVRFGWDHPGYAYGYQRNLICEHGFYDRCVAGSSDVLISKAAIGRHRTARSIVERYNQESLEYYWKWADAFFEDVNEQVNYARDTNVYHLYHGKSSRRQYISRNKYLTEHFNHATDLEINPDNGCYRLVPDKEFIRDYLNSYFQKRNDDFGRQSI